MNWILLAIAGYLILAVVNILDKLLLKKYIAKPSSYASYVGLTGIFAWILAPLGFSLDTLSTKVALLGFFSGVSLITALIFFFSAVKRAEISRVVALSGAFTPVMIWLLGSWATIENFSRFDLLAFFMLIIGGVSIILHRGNSKFPFKILYLTFLASLFFALSWFMIKLAYLETGFWNAFIMSRTGEFLMGLTIFLFSSAKNEALPHFENVNKKGLVLFLGNKSLAASGFILINYAVFLGSVSMVSAIKGVQYAFVFILALITSNEFPGIVKERISTPVILQKIISILLIGAGLFILYNRPVA